MHPTNQDPGQQYVGIRCYRVQKEAAKQRSCALLAGAECINAQSGWTHLRAVESVRKSSVPPEAGNVIETGGIPVVKGSSIIPDNMIYMMRHFLC